MKRSKRALRHARPHCGHGDALAHTHRPAPPAPRDRADRRARPWRPLAVAAAPPDSRPPPRPCWRRTAPAADPAWRASSPANRPPAPAGRPASKPRANSAWRLKNIVASPAEKGAALVILSIAAHTASGQNRELLFETIQSLSQAESELWPAFFQNHGAASTGRSCVDHHIARCKCLH